MMWGRDNKRDAKRKCFTWLSFKGNNEILCGSETQMEQCTITLNVWYSSCHFNFIFHRPFPTGKCPTFLLLFGWSIPKVLVVLVPVSADASWSCILGLIGPQMDRRVGILLGYLSRSRWSLTYSQKPFWDASMHTWQAAAVQLFWNFFAYINFWWEQTEQGYWSEMDIIILKKHTQQINKKLSLQCSAAVLGNYSPVTHLLWKSPAVDAK